MLTDLSRADFDFYRNYADKMKSTHAKEFMQEITPDIIRCLYRGKKKPQNFSRLGQLPEDQHNLMLVTLFSSANTILPNLYYKNPNPIIEPLRGATDDSAAILTALEKHYMRVNNAKIENQDAVLNSYFFGLGWKKLGYKVAYEVPEQFQEEPESMEVEEKPSILNMLGMGKPAESNKVAPKPDYQTISDEGLFNASESPLHVMLDYKTDLLNGKMILHSVPRTLYDLMNFGPYDKEAIDTLYKKYRYVKGNRMDVREVDLILNELHITQRNGTWILSWINDFDKPLQYDRSTYQGKGFQFCPLMLTNEPGVRYPISQMKIASQVQEKLNKMAEMYYEKVSRNMNLTFINKNDLEKGQLEAIEQNRIQGIVVTNKPVNAGTFASASSPNIQNDLIQLMQACQQNMIEVMGADAQLVQGRSKNDTLGQDELARVGTKIRESGMQDRVQDWMISQAEKECCLLQEYSNGTLEISVGPEDHSNPMVSDGVQQKVMEFMTLRNPMGAKTYIKGEYRHTFNIEEAIRPDSQSIRLGLEKILTTYAIPMVRQDMNNDGFRLRTGLMWKEWVKTFEVLGNPSRYVEQIDSMQLANMQVRELLMKNPQAATPTPVPTAKEKPVSAGKNPMDREPSTQVASL